MKKILVILIGLIVAYPVFADTSCPNGYATNGVKGCQHPNKKQYPDCYGTKGTVRADHHCKHSSSITQEHLVSNAICPATCDGTTWVVKLGTNACADGYEPDSTSKKCVAKQGAEQSSQPTPQPSAADPEPQTPPQSYSGRVVDKSGNPLADVHVYYTNAEDAGVQTTSDGKWTLAAPKDGSTTLNFTLNGQCVARTNIALDDDSLSEIVMQPINDDSTKCLGKSDAGASAEATASGGASGTQSRANADANNDNGAGKLSRDDTKKELDELNENLDNQKQKEQSLANRTLAAAGMGATGIGLSQALSAKAEQDADDDAERAMRAYLETFKCTWGSSGRARGGETNIAVGDGNDTTALHSKYMQLADSLKMRKESLNITPGIESEVIIDTATTGLYDDVGDTRGTGAFASLSRALMDPNGADAEMWASQKSKTSEKLKTGTTIAAVGAIGSLAGNLALNTGKRASALRERSDEIRHEYWQILNGIQNDINSSPVASTPCPDNSTGTAPYCQCNDKTQYYDANSNKCTDCPSNQVQSSSDSPSVCECPADMQYMDTQTHECYQLAPTASDICENVTCTGNHVVKYVDNNNTCHCGCNDGYTYDSNSKSCTCPEPNIDQEGKCVAEVGASSTTTITNNKIILYNDALFEFGKADLTTKAKAAIAKFDKLKDANCKFFVYGYTDKSGTPARNGILSTQRAEAVKDAIEGIISDSVETATGYGENYCTCDTIEYAKYPQDKKTNIDYKACAKANERNWSTYVIQDGMRYAPCRRVEIGAWCQDTETVTTVIKSINETITPQPSTQQ